ncbi:MAG: hypothetical protein NTV01_12655 [Bacteroidia bacterium]|nr:hypothetical protein [Bacteroidia bacterium]
MPPNALVIPANAGTPSLTTVFCRCFTTFAPEQREGVPAFAGMTEK